MKKIKQYLNISNNMIFLYLGSSKHKIKRKAEKMGCEQAINMLSND